MSPLVLFVLLLVLRLVVYRGVTQRDGRTTERNDGKPLPGLSATTASPYLFAVGSRTLLVWAQAF